MPPNSSQSTQMRSDHMLEIASAAAARPIVLQRSESALPSPIGEGRNGCSNSSADWAAEHPQSGNTNVAVAEMAAAGEEGNTDCSRWSDDNKAMTEEEVRRWLSSRSTSSASLSPRNAECLTVSTVVGSGCDGGGGDNQSKRGVEKMWSSRGMWQPKPISSSQVDHVLGGTSRRKGGNDVECNVVDKETEETSRGYESPPAGGGSKEKAQRERTDDKLRGALPTLASVKSTVKAAALYQASGRYSRPMSGATSCSHKPRRDSFGASLQAAIKTSSLSLPRPLVLTHRREGDNGGSPIVAATTTANGPRLQLPRSQERRRVLDNRPQITLAELLGTRKRVDDRPLQESPHSKDTEKSARWMATEAALSRHREHTVGLEFGRKSSCPEWMNDEDWQQVRDEGGCGTTARKLVTL